MIEVSRASVVRCACTVDHLPDVVDKGPTRLALTGKDLATAHEALKKDDPERVLAVLDTRKLGPDIDLEYNRSLLGVAAEQRRTSAQVPSNEALRAVDFFLAGSAEQIQRTRKGRVWQVWVGGRAVHVALSDALPGFELSAGCNSMEDCALLQRPGTELAELLGGVASDSCFAVMRPSHARVRRVARTVGRRGYRAQARRTSRCRQGQPEKIPMDV